MRIRLGLSTCWAETGSARADTEFCRKPAAKQAPSRLVLSVYAHPRDTLYTRIDSPLAHHACRSTAWLQRLAATSC
jgi:hypothetical protein